MYGSQSGSRVLILREPFSVYGSFGFRAPVFSCSLHLLSDYLCKLCIFRGSVLVMRLALVITVIVLIESCISLPTVVNPDNRGCFINVYPYDVCPGKDRLVTPIIL